MSRTRDWLDESGFEEYDCMLPPLPDDIEIAGVEIEAALAEDVVNNPSHYADGAIEAIDAMKSMMSDEEFKGYLRGNTFKYLWRCTKKGNTPQDLDKAIWYLNTLRKEY